MFGMGTGVSPPLWSPDLLRSDIRSHGFGLRPADVLAHIFTQASSYVARNFVFILAPEYGTTIFTGEALDRFVSVRSTYHYASTPDRSTLSSSRGLTPLTGWDTLS